MILCVEINLSSLKTSATLVFWILRSQDRRRIFKKLKKPTLSRRLAYPDYHLSHYTHPHSSLDIQNLLETALSGAELPPAACTQDCRSGSAPDTGSDLRRWCHPCEGSKIIIIMIIIISHCLRIWMHFYVMTMAWFKALTPSQGIQWFESKFKVKWYTEYS